MKKIENFETAQKAARYDGGAKLEPGAYVCKVLSVKFENGKDGNSDRIDIAFDIAEGDNKDFFKNQYDANTDENKKWKGRTSIYCPSGDGSEKDGWTAKNLAKWTNAFEDSNKGYSWDWDESKWKGLSIGIVFGTTGTVIDGKEITYTEARTAISVDNARAGKFWSGYLNLKAKNGYTGNAASNSDSNGFLAVADDSEEEIPFL